MSVEQMDDEKLDLSVEQMLAARFHMPEQTTHALRVAAAIVIQKMAKFVHSDDFDKLSTSDKLKIMNAILDRAFGETEKPSEGLAIAGMMAKAKGTPTQIQSSDHSAQIERIEARKTFPEKKVPSVEDLSSRNVNVVDMRDKSEAS